MKPRVLVVNEASFLNTGYAIYGRNILNRLYRDGYDVAELGIYTSDKENRAIQIPWRFYSNLPMEHELDQFNSDGCNPYGKFRFEQVVCDFKPHVVWDIRDSFMYDFEYYSPLRDKYHLMVKAPVDGVPQQQQWLDIFNDVDTLCTYTEWAKKHLEEYGIKVADYIYPAASEQYFPIKQQDIDNIKRSLGFENTKIIGTIMRNQPRKLFEVIIRGFAEYIQKYQDYNTILYLHAAVPDVGFDIVKLLMEYGVLSRTVFTYMCKNCNKSFPKYFSDIITYCQSCKTKSVKMSDIYSALSEDNMNKIINMFDLYIQCASREGFGMPQAEAAACGIPIATVPYAGMNDFIDKLDCMKIENYEFKLNNGMHMYEAVPNSSSLAEIIRTCLSQDVKTTKRNIIRQDFERHFSSWESVYKKWKNLIDAVDTQTLEEIQNKPYNVSYNINLDVSKNNLDFSSDLIEQCLDKRFIGKYIQYRIIKDLNNGVSFDNLSNYYVQHFNGLQDTPFNKEVAMQVFSHIAERKNYWRTKYNESISNKSS